MRGTHLYTLRRCSCSNRSQYMHPHTLTAFPTLDAQSNDRVNGYAGWVCRDIWLGELRFGRWTHPPGFLRRGGARLRLDGIAIAPNFWENFTQEFGCRDWP
jgi:hypothetical protein